MKKKIEYKPKSDCEHCGGIHIGSYKCPYLESDPGGHIVANRESKNMEKSEVPPV